MLMVILVGALVSIPALIAGYFFARYMGPKVHSSDDADETAKSYDQLKAEYGKLPGVAISFAPIVMPIVLMGVKSVVDMAGMTRPVCRNSSVSGHSHGRPGRGPAHLPGHTLLHRKGR